MTDSLKNVYSLFPKQEDCISFLETLRWENEPICPYCARSNFVALKNEQRYHCKNCTASFSVTVRTIFHKSKIDLQKWFYLIYLIFYREENITARQLGEDFNITKDSAWRMQSRIKEWTEKDTKLLNQIASKLGGPKMANII